MTFSPGALHMAGYPSMDSLTTVAIHRDCSRAGRGRREVLSGIPTFSQLGPPRLLMRRAAATVESTLNYSLPGNPLGGYSGGDASQWSGACKPRSLGAQEPSSVLSCPRG